MSELSVSCPAVVRITVTSPASHLCPFRDEVDDGTVQVSWTTSQGETLELHTLAQLIRGRAGTEISHEQWTADLVDMINAGAKVADLTVSSQWSTAGMSVSVAADQGEGAVDG